MRYVSLSFGSRVCATSLVICTPYSEHANSLQLLVSTWRQASQSCLKPTSVWFRY